jgi:cellulose synthase operon protein C
VLDIHLQKDGRARVHATETVRGTGAVSWRGELESVPDAELEQRFEAEYVARLFPGAQLRSVDIAERAARKDAIEMQYNFDVAMLGRRVSQGWALPPMLAAKLAHNYATLAARSTTALVGRPLEFEVVLRIQLPDGAGRPDLTAPVQVEGKLAGRPRFSASQRYEQNMLIVERKLELPQMRVAPDDYPAFASFCHAVDAAEAKELLVKLP